MRTRVLVLITILAIALSGCIINVPLFPQQAPLKEQTLEGSGGSKIALLDLSGFISSDERSQSIGPDRPSMVAELREELRLAANDDDVRGVVLRINSPGGTVAASDMLYHELLEFKEGSKKPVYAVITSIGTSGAYFTASATDLIWAHPTAVTGSIGVLAMNVEVSGLMEKLGVKDKTIKSGENKDMFSPLHPDTPEETAIMQGIIDDMYGRFLDVVEAGRKGKLNRSQIEVLADGRPYTAAQALKAGLIDQVGFLDEAIEAMKSELGVKEAKVVTYIRPGAYKNNIYSAPPGGVNVNVFNLEPGLLGYEPGVRFLYVWGPEL